MKKAVRCILTLAVILACVCACSNKGKVIPRSKLAHIYADMVLVDSWLYESTMEVRMKADTMSIYEPVFRKYGFSTEDYSASVSYYLNDPERFARILKKSESLLRAEMKELEAQREKEKKMQREGSAKHQIQLKNPFTRYDTLFSKPSFTDRINIQKDSMGRYLPVRVQEDTMFFGPEVIVDTTALEAPQL